MINIIIKILALIIASKYLNIGKIKLFIVYKILKFFIVIISKSIFKVMYEDTIKGLIITSVSCFFNKNGYKIKRFVVYSFIIGINLLKIFHKYLPEELVIILNLGGGFQLKEFIGFILTILYNVILDFIRNNSH